MKKINNLFLKVAAIYSSWTTNVKAFAYGRRSTFAKICTIFQALTTTSARTLTIEYVILIATFTLSLQNIVYKDGQNNTFFIRIVFFLLWCNIWLNTRRRKTTNSLRCLLKLWQQEANPSWCNYCLAMVWEAAA